MSDHARRKPRPVQPSTPQASHMLHSSLRPSGFLNMLNPMMGRTYTGYLRADQSVLEEEEDELEDDANVEDAGAMKYPFTSGGNTDRRVNVNWGESSRMNVIRHNNQGEQHQKQEDSSDDEVPQSFMIEAAPGTRQLPSRKGKGRDPGKRSSRSSTKRPVLPVTVDDTLKLPPRPIDLEPIQSSTSHPETARKQMRGLDAYERALWNWVNVYDLDVFLQDVYRYYEGKGIYSIALSRALHLLTFGFTIAFSTFLLNCIDYSRIKPEGITRLSDVVVDRCISKFPAGTVIFFIFFIGYYALQIVTFVFEVLRLVDMYNFYTHLLGIPDADIQTISWPEVVRRIEAIREENPVTAISSANQGNPSSSVSAKLDAHDIANRIMREENYLIAIFNKDLLDLRIPVPLVLKQLLSLDGGQGMTLSTALELNLRICLMRYLFDARGRVKEAFLKEKNRSALITGLRHRFIFMGILNAILAPFIVLYLVMYYFFRYFEEYHKNPSSIGGRNYTLYARWKFREFNELPHLFSRRLNESHPTASMYIGQFPNEKIALIMRFVSFVAGSFTAILVLASIIDPDLFTHFEITPHRTVLFYITVFGTIMAVTRGMIPEDNTIFDPELLMMEVIHYTHYMPTEWKGQLHSQKVHKEFGTLFDMKVMIFVRELLSVVLTPFVLCYSLPNCAPAIIDFFREFTIHVDSLGYVCSFAVFDFKRHGNVHFGAPTRVKDERYLSKEGKMEKSFLNFKAANPEWQPTDPSGSLYLNRVADFNARALRRRIPDPHGLPERRLGDRAQEYDRALRESQNAALRRRSSMFKSSSPIEESISESAAAEEPVASTSGAAVTKERVMDESLNPFSTQKIGELHPDDLAEDGDVRSGLGDSYVDGKVSRARASTRPTASQQVADDKLEDGGMLGLLAQIYGTRGPGFGP